MEDNKLQRLLQKDSNRLKNAFKFLSDLQQGTITPMDSGIDHLNKVSLGGILPGTVTSIVARSGNGKSYTLGLIKNALLSDPEKDIKVLHFNFEMPLFQLVLLELKKALKKPFSDITSYPMSEEEKPIYRKIYNEYDDDRYHMIQDLLTPQEIYAVTKQFIQANKNTKNIVVFIDHIGIIKSTNAPSPIPETMELINQLKLEFPLQVSFILLGQMNREIEKRWTAKDGNRANYLPSSSDIYGSDILMQFSDIIMAQVLPRAVGMEGKYAAVSRNANPHLFDHFVPEEQSGKAKMVNLNAFNRIYYHYIKMRLDDGTIPRHYCSIINPEIEDTVKEQSYYETDPKEDELQF